MRGLINKVGVGKPLAVEGVPMACMDGAVGILDDDAVNREKDVGRFADGEVLAKGSAGCPFDLGVGKAAGQADGVLVGLGHEPLVDARFGDGTEARVLEVEAVVVAGEDDELFAAAAVDPAVEDLVFDVE